MSESRPYRRPIDPKWWWAPGPYRAYTLRELSGVAVALYGAVLFAGLICLVSGPMAWDSFLGFLRSPVSIVLHLVLLAGVVYHVKTWFETLPKTMPKMIVNGKQVPATEITRKAQMVAAGCSLVLVVIAAWAFR
ncbi:fumarate reductase subunit C [Roseiarcus fermentans]|uniref:Fumarate reductase subunit C n=1 Tax=Roseiarcus fermentans TaxID=1473586 RepID=A0A366ERN5_9HYPH|nr:fumarate reductase subunit C [Roseiarcus fermentans]RBP05067.1 fumarate reductase subunit C [Roseiarcus fermentans]